jgi:ABC-type polysaccharide/polyol phosphate export permease
MPGMIPVESFVWAAFTVWFTFGGIWQPVKSTRTMPPVPYPGVSAMHHRIALAVWPLVLNATFCYVSVALMIIFGDNVSLPNIPLTALILVITAALSLGLGLVIGALCQAVPLIEPVAHILPYIMLLGSGLYFSITDIPRFMQEIMIWSPVLHLVEYERHAFDSGYPIGLVSLWYPTFWAAGLLIVGLAMTKRFR